MLPFSSCDPGKDESLLNHGYRGEMIRFTHLQESSHEVRGELVLALQVLLVEVGHDVRSSTPVVEGFLGRGLVSLE